VISNRLLPHGDEISLRTWRRESENTLFARYYGYTYPTAGCHGAPLEKPCPCMIEWVKGTKHKAAGCNGCNGTGRIRLDAPNRRDVP
jgi:hypothetical protein